MWFKRSALQCAAPHEHFGLKLGGAGPAAELAAAVTAGGEHASNGQRYLHMIPDNENKWHPVLAAVIVRSQGQLKASWLLPCVRK